MDITTLPYETQFRILLSLPLLDVIKYCNVNTVTATICKTYAFWNLKAKRDFGISLDLVPGNMTYREKYELAGDEGGLISHLIISRKPELFGRLWAIIRNKVDHNKDGNYQRLLTYVLEDIVSIGDDETVALFLEELEPYLAELDDNEQRQDILRATYFAAVLKDMDDSVALLNKYYDWQEDRSEFLQEWIILWANEDDPATLERLADIGLVPDDII